LLKIATTTLGACTTCTI
jgi:hypothetical protein